MAKALYISMLAEGHVNPTLGLVTDLIRRGEHIVYYSSNHFQAKIEKTGAIFRSVDQRAQRKLQEASFLLNSQPEEFLLQFLNALEMVMDTILDEISNETYDYILYDAQSIVGTWIAHQCNLLSIATWTTFAFSHDPHENMGLTGSGDMKRKQERLAMLQEFLRWEKIQERKKQLENKYDVPLPGNFLLCPGPGDLNIVFTSSYFQRNSEEFKDNYIFVGPSLPDSSNLGDFPIEELQGKRVIFISMGTIVNQQLELYQKCFTALKDLDGKVVLSIGKNVTREELGDVPDNFIVYHYVPQLDVLRQTNVFISHCGMNSTSESLYFEVPLVMLPIINDQPVIAQRVKELGAGVLLDFQNLSSEDIKQAVHEVLQNPIYQERAKIISQSFHKAGGHNKAADEVFKFTRTMTKR
ncbi:macrolide family glycosyltransferase [Brevibacillus laterosporus]|uniref:Glycosyl transferase n=1 Tax=Brevibacillus laterosporus TaxID=1465 RepID=A0AAP8QBG3_BRELA|nr:macrolide family glycosyltransferase [Brevibacillus laterosporus]PPA93558.1 glycosyl transferase [Brevibacillus laterosporus]